MKQLTATFLQRSSHAVVELSLIVLLCYLFAGSPPPAVNEVHYLGKAKNHWNPEWCQGDFFFESADAHAVFYWTFGWVTKFATLSTSAWMGRLIVWWFFAVSWRSLVYTITDVRWAGLLSSILLLPLVHYVHLSGEWLIGGVEAKGFAWPLVFLGMARVCEGKWWLAWPLFGLASSFHVIIGGWAVITTLIAWLMRRRAEDLNLIELAIWLMIGGCFALPGLIPALQLTAKASVAEIQEASMTYTFRRLSHHLVFNQFAWWNTLRFALLLSAWWWYVAKFVAPTESQFRLWAVISGSLWIAATGIAIDYLTGPFPQAQGLRASLLRYYWFRMGDILVPVGVAISLVSALRQRASKVPCFALSLGIIIAALGIGRALGTVGFAARSTAIQQQTWLDLSDQIDIEQIELAWRDVCRWICDPSHVPPRSIFLTPTGQQTFKWYAQRPDVVTWKDVPQDATGINAWWKRRQEVYLLGDWPWNDTEKFANIVSDYGVTHVVWPDSDDRPSPDHATELYRNDFFRVFALE